MSLIGKSQLLLLLLLLHDFEAVNFQADILKSHFACSRPIDSIWIHPYLPDEEEVGYIY
jgi:hypothetical protein